jgi:serine/threonine protein kinase
MKADDQIDTVGPTSSIVPDAVPSPASTDEDDDSMELIENRVVLQPIRVIARGGMGLIYEADVLGAEGFAKRVAVKTLRRKWCNNRRFIELLVAEAKLVASLVHENIAQVYQLGRLKDGRHYLVMEFVNGLSLRDVRRRLERAKVTLPTKLAIHIASRVARGLGYAHSFRDRSGTCLHIVHRDICPNNILVSTEGLTKLIDFGVAKARTTSVIGDDCRMGKIAYMSPEQALRRTVDDRSDIFSLGAVLFEMLSEKPLRTVDTDVSVEEAIAPPAPWASLRDDVDDELRSILARMLAFDPTERFDNANALARCLEEYIYRCGYGPTVQTVEAFLRDHCPELYQPTTDDVPLTPVDHSTLTLPS